MFRPGHRFNPEHIGNNTNPMDLHHRKTNFRLCTAIDMTSVSIALDHLVEAGMPQAQADYFKDNASSLLALLLTENNRLHGF